MEALWGIKVALPCSGESVEELGEDDDVQNIDVELNNGSSADFGVV